MHFLTDVDFVCTLAKCFALGTAVKWLLGGVAGGWQQELGGTLEDPIEENI